MGSVRCNTGPMEARDLGPTGRRLGTDADCYDGSPWELHRGELLEQARGGVADSIAMALVAALFRIHARAGLTVMTDVYCDLSDDEGPSQRVPDVVVVSDLSKPRNDAYRGTPVLAVEIRGAESKRYLEEKVRLYLEHDWPWIWIAHAARREVELLRRGVASVTYRPGAEVPLIPELDKHGLRAVPVAAFFDDSAALRFIDGWVLARGEANGRAQAILGVLLARGLDVSKPVRARIAATTDLATLDRWLALAATASSADAFARALG